MKYLLGISNFLEEISSLSHSIGFLYFFTLMAKEGFHISPCSSLERCIQMVISFLFSFAFSVSSLHSCLQGLLREPFCFLEFLFLGVFLISPSCTTSWTSIHSSSGQETPREHTGHSKHPLPRTQESTLHMDITKWSSGFSLLSSIKVWILK